MVLFLKCRSAFCAYVGTEGADFVGYAYYVVDGVGLVVVRYVHTEKA